MQGRNYKYDTKKCGRKGRNYKCNIKKTVKKVGIFQISLFFFVVTLFRVGNIRAHCCTNISWVHFVSIGITFSVVSSGVNRKVQKMYSPILKQFFFSPKVRNTASSSFSSSSIYIYVSHIYWSLFHQKRETICVLGLLKSKRKEDRASRRWQISGHFYSSIHWITVW